MSKTRRPCRTLFDRSAGSTSERPFLFAGSGFAFYDPDLFSNEDDCSASTDCSINRDWLDVYNDVSEEMLDPRFNLSSDPFDIDNYDDAGRPFRGYRDNGHDVYRMETSAGRFEADLGNARAEEIFALTGIWVG